ncbi:MAG TPA: ABC transporter substrate-binding protein [Burkholderiales bacterium]|nr:ABC transporter substrate-binding protein [Burkholderiales bacterium]
MKLRIAENFRAVFYAPFYAIRALGLPEREGLEIEWLPSETRGGTIEQVKRGAIDAQWGGPMRVLKDHDSPNPSLLSFGEVVWRDPFYLIGRRNDGFKLQDLASLRLGIVSEVPTPWYCLRADLADAGLDTATLRVTNNRTMPQQLEALNAGQLDVIQLFEPYASRALADGYSVLYAQSSRGPTAYTAFITSRECASKNRDALAALERATQAMLDWLAKEGPAGLARVTASFFPDVPQELLRAGFERYQRAGLWTRTTTLSEKGFERLAYSLQLGGFIKRRAPYAECVRSFPTPRGA